MLIILNVKPKNARVKTKLTLFDVIFIFRYGLSIPVVMTTRNFWRSLTHIFQTVKKSLLSSPSPTKQQERWEGWNTTLLCLTCLIQLVLKFITWIGFSHRYIQSLQVRYKTESNRIISISLNYTCSFISSFFSNKFSYLAGFFLTITYKKLTCKH